MDNYSRFIFSATASLTLSSEENKQNIIKALKQYKDLFAKQKSIILICDGGGENKGEVDILLDDLENKPYKILKEVANNVTLFNTLVEASHNNLKRYHFLKKGYANIKALQTHLQQCIFDNNFIIPKDRLEGLLPSEVLIDKMIPDKHQYKKEEEETRRKRIQTNQNLIANYYVQQTKNWIIPDVHKVKGLLS